MPQVQANHGEGAHDEAVRYAGRFDDKLKNDPWTHQVLTSRQLFAPLSSHGNTDKLYTPRATRRSVKMPRLFTLSALIWVLSLSTLTSAQLSSPTPTPCSGYVARDVTQGDTFLTATLTLAGSCRLYGPDVSKLRILVEYQTGEAFLLTFHRWHSALTRSRFTTPCPH